MNSAKTPWPPLIVAADVPRLVRWRDFLLTLIMWGLFAALLGAELGSILGISLEQFGFGPPGKDAERPRYVEQLMPFFLATATLGVMLIAASVLTLRRRRRSLHLPQPAPLEAADQARGAGLDEAALIAARERRIVIIHIDADSRYQIEVPNSPDIAISPN